MQSNSVNGQPDIANITVVTDERQVIVPQAITSVVEVNNPGPQGPVGPQGPAGPSVPFTDLGNNTYATTSSLQVTGSFLVSGSSTFTNIGPAIFSGSTSLVGATTMSSAVVTGNVQVLGTASISVLQINTTINSTGSNILGDAANDTQTLFGSVIVPTGSLVVSGSTIISSSANTQLQVGSNLLFVSSSGRVGIGTNTPTNTLDVIGIARVSGSIILESPGITSYYFPQYTDVYGSNYSFNTHGSNYIRFWAQDTGYLTFWTATTEKIRLFNNGNLLLQNGGTFTDAGYRLDVSGSAKVNEGIFGIGTSGTILPLVNTAGTGTVVVGGTSPNTPALRIQGSPLNFFIGSTQVAQMFATTGNFALQSGGTFTDAGFRLDVSGSARVTGEANVSFLSLSGNTAVNSSGTTLILGASSGWSGVRVPRYFETTGSISAASAIARGTYLNQTLVATANNDTLVGLDIQPTFTPGAFTGVAQIGLRVAGDIVPSTDNTRVLGSSSLRFNNIYAAQSVINTMFTGNIRSNLTGGVRILANNGTQWAQWYDATGNLLLQNGGTFTDSGARLHISGSTSEALLVASSSAGPALYVSGSGNVGIGTANPDSYYAKKLVVSAVDESGITIAGTTTSATNYLAFADGTTGNQAYRGYVAYRHLTDQLAFGTGGTLRATIDNSGNFGIGTSTSTILARTHIQGSGTTSATTALRVENTNASASLVVLDNGYVGIGTSSAQYQLDVYGTYHQYQAQGGLARYDISSANANQNRGVWDFYTNAAVTPDFFGRFGFKFEGGTADSFKQFQVHVADSTTPKFVVDGSGRMGIGTIVPSAQLHVSGSSSSALLRIDSPASSSILFVSGSGNVGINTNSSAYRLQVDASGSSNSPTPLALTSIDVNNRVGILFASSSISAGKQHRLFHRVNTPTVEWLLGASAGETAMWRFLPRDDTNYGVNILASFNGGTSYLNTGLSQSLFSLGAGSQTAQYLNISSSGNVGIGTATPAYALDVNGTIRSQGQLIVVGQIQNPTIGVVDVNGVLYSGTGVSIGVNSTNTARLLTRGSGTTSATTTFLLQNSTPTNLLSVLDNGQVSFTSPTMTLATSQSAFSISPIISASNVVGGQYYGVNITPTFFQTTGSQTETAFRVAATYNQSSAVATSGTNVIADFGSTSAGSQLTVTDVTSGSIYMVNDVSGLPIIEATSNWDVNIYDFPNKIFEKTGSQVNIYGTMRVSGSFVLPLSQSATPQLGSAYWSGSLLFIYNGTRYMSASFA